MKIDIVRAWKDELYRQSLGEEGYTLPENPVGEIELTDADLGAVYGGWGGTGGRGRHSGRHHDGGHHGGGHHGGGWDGRYHGGGRYRY